MEQSFQTLLLAGKYLSGDVNFPPLSPSDDTYTDQTTSHTQTHLNPYTSPYDAFNEYSNYHCFENEQIQQNLKRLKTEPSHEPFNFTPNRLPDLQSIEPMSHIYSPLATTPNHQTLESLLTYLKTTANRFNPPQSQPQLLQPPLPPPAKVSSRDLASKRRRTLTEKTRALQNLLPVEKKLDMASIYEEAYKYIKFLKAQIASLESMPDCSTSTSNFRSGNPRYGGLGKLNRQEVLHVMVNSPAVQASLYSKGCCVYSIEQLMLFNDGAQKRFFVSDQSF